jgi:hypothetical protein
MSCTSAATIAAKELTNALQNSAPATPFATICNAQLVALKQLANIFPIATAQPKITNHNVPTERVAIAIPTIVPPRVEQAPYTGTSGNQPHLIFTPGKIYVPMQTRLFNGTYSFDFLTVAL